MKTRRSDCRIQRIFLILFSIAQPDIRLTLDPSGVIRDANLSPTAFLGEEVGDWFGRRWCDTVGDGGAQINSMIEAANAIGASAFGQVEQHFPSGRLLPVEYTTVRLGDGAGLIAVGKNLATVATVRSQLRASQLEREQDHWRLRDVQLEDRRAFEAAAEAIVAVQPSTLCVLELNPAATRAFGLAPGDSVEEAFDATGANRLRKLIAQTRLQGRHPSVIVHLGVEQTAWLLRTSVTSVGAEPAVVFQLAPCAPHDSAPSAGAPSLLALLTERLPDAFVVISRTGIVVRANSAFFDMVQAGSDGAVLGRHVGEWLSEPDADIGALLDRIERHLIVRRFGTILHGQMTDTLVEISAVGSHDDRPDYIGLVLRRVTERMELVANDAGLQRFIPPCGELGRTPLVKLVRDATAMIERDYILAALRQVGGNRSAAADLLGMSRQTLYMKLARYGDDEAIPLTYGRSA